MLPDRRSISHLLRNATSLLASSSSPQLDAMVILVNASGLTKERIMAHPELKLNNKVINKFYFDIGRRNKNFPVAYITGRKEFFGLNFKVNLNVLIPRPETEGIVTLALKLINNSPKGLIKVLDLGTGSGCIAISLLSKTDKNITIRALDISTAALKIAKLNASLILGKKKKSISFQRADYLKYKFKDKFDLILSNPPYIPYIKKLELQKDLSYEPITALFGGLNGLEHYIGLKNILQEHLRAKGKAIIEIGEQSRSQLRRIFNKPLQIQFEQDLSGRDRYLIISHQS